MKRIKAPLWRFATLMGTLALITASMQTTFAQWVCQLQGAPVVQMGSLTAGDPTQTGRVVRGGIPSTCIGKSNTLQNSTPVNQDNYTFMAPVTGCATVDFDASACGGATTQAVAYSSFNPAAPATNVIGDFGFSTTGVSRFSFPVTQGQNYTIVVHDILETPTNVLCTNYTFTVRYRTGCRQPGFDLTNDSRADPTVFRPSTSNWMTASSAGGTLTQNFGLSADIITAGDYTGDGNTDVSIFRPSTNFWYYGNNTVNPGQNFSATPWGATNDIPTPGDFDGDGKADIAVFRPSDGIWYVLQSATNSVSFVRWGTNGDIPVTADFDGDLRTDFAVVRTNVPGITPNYQWFVLQSNFAFGFPLIPVWGIAGDRIVPGDYDGNGKADVAVWRPSDGQWYIIPSNTQNAVNTARIGFQWGAAGDIPQPADYDGDEITDVAVFRPADGNWYSRNSSNNTASIINLGNATDQPATAPYRVPNP